MRSALSALVILAAFQDAGEEIKRQAGRITAKDPSASFDAISRLVDLSAASRPAVESAMESLGDDVAFYRKALKDELDTRARLGERYGAVNRISIDAKDKSLASVIQELQEKSKEKIDAYWLMQSRGSQPITIKIDDVPVLEALRAVAAEAKARIYNQWGIIQLSDGGGGSAPAFQYRNFLLTATTLQKMRDVQFGGSVIRTLNLSLQAAWDRGTSVARCDAIEVLECVDDKGRALEQVKDEEKPVSAESPTVVNVGGYSTSVQARLQWPAEDAEKISRFRAGLVLRIPVESSTYALAAAEKTPTKSDEHAEVTLDSIRNEPRRAEATVRIKPKVPIADFRKMTVMFRMKLKDGEARSCYASGKLADGTVEYLLNPRLTGEEQAARKQVEIDSVEVVIVRTTEERRLTFELRDLPLK